MVYAKCKTDTTEQPTRLYVTALNVLNVVRTTVMVVWLECLFLDTEVDGSNPGNSMLFPWARRFIRIASVDSAVKWVSGGDNLVKDVQCYELFGGIAQKNQAFSFFIFNVSETSK